VRGYTWTNKGLENKPESQENPPHRQVRGIFYAKRKAKRGAENEQRNKILPFPQ